jgi:hypothetical protein
MFTNRTLLELTTDGSLVAACEAISAAKAVYHCKSKTVDLCFAPKKALKTDVAHQRPPPWATQQDSHTSDGELVGRCIP